MKMVDLIAFELQKIYMQTRDRYNWMEGFYICAQFEPLKFFLKETKVLIPASL
jgi:hypothetical protein